MKDLLLMFVAVSLLALPVSAGLLEDVDNLTPEQAVELQQKLEQKRFEANTPENSRISGFMQTIRPDMLNSAFPNLGPMTNLYGGVFDVRHAVTDQFLVGGSFGGAANYLLTETGPRVYEDMFLAYGTAQFVVDYRFVNTENFICSLTPGAGVILGGFMYSRTDDAAQTSYNTNRWGSGLCSSLSLDLTWKAYKDWGFGFGASTFSGKVGGLRKIVSNVDPASPEIDLSGTTFRISGSKYF